MKFTPEQQVEFFLNLNRIVTQQNASKIISELTGYERLWKTFSPDIYGQIILHLGEAYRLTGDIERAIAFMEESIDAFSKIREFDYQIKSIMYHHLGVYYSEINNEINGLNAFKKHVFYLLIDNQLYNDFDFYSFRPCSKYAFEDLQNNTLTVSSPTQFNDPMDCLVFPWLEDKKAQLSKDSQLVAAKLLSKAYSYIKVRCFVRNTPLPTAENSEPLARNRIKEQFNSLMWAHYAKNHTGYCVKYVFPKGFISDDTNQCILSRWGNVDYVDKVSLKDTLTIKDAFFKKSKDWSYETEVRLLHYDPNINNDYKSIVLPQNCIKEIFFGLHCSEENKQKIRELLHGQNVHYYQITTQSDDFYLLSSQSV